jgi:Cu+-exporting ATPase
MGQLIAMGTSAADIPTAFFRCSGSRAGKLAAVEELYFETAGIIITLILRGKTLRGGEQGTNLRIDQEN